MKYKIIKILSLLILLTCIVGCSESSLLNPDEVTINENTPELDLVKAKKEFSEFSFEIGDNDFELNVLYNKK